MALKMMGPRIATLDTRRVKSPPKTADPFYLTPEWRALVRALIKARGRRCEECGRTHDAEGHPVRIFGDHVVEVRDGGALLDPANIKLLDGRCHGKKTAKARAKRAAARPEEEGGSQSPAP